MNLLAYLKKVIEGDFKTTETKFLKEGITKEEIKEYFDLFKSLKNKNKITKNEEKDIDFWGKAGWGGFKEFVDKLKITKTKTEQKKIIKMAGAALVDETDKWYVYHITTHEAAMKYGSGTKWCITEKEGFHWKQYSVSNNIYFFISKTLTDENPLYKIAVLVDASGEKEYWNAKDEQMKHPPKNMPVHKLESFDLNKQPEKVQLEAVRDNAEVIQFIENPSEKIQLEAVEYGSYIIEYIKNPSEKIQHKAIMETVEALKYIENPSEKIQLVAVGENEFSIQFIKKPCKSKESALSMLITLADFKTTEVKFLDHGVDKSEIDEYFKDFKELKSRNKITNAQEKDIDFWGKKSWEEFTEFVDKLKTEKTKTEERKLKKMEGAKFISEDDNWYYYQITSYEASKLYGAGTKWCISANNDDGSGAWQRYNDVRNIYFLFNKKITDSENPYYKVAVLVDGLGHLEAWDALDEEIKINSDYPDVYINKSKFKKFEYANIEDLIRNHPSEIRNIENPSERLQLIAVRKDGYKIIFIKNPTEKVQLEAVRENGYAIRYIKNPSEQVQLEAVKQNGYALEYIKNPSEKIQFEAVKQDGGSLEYIKNEKVQLEIVKKYPLAIQYIKNPTEKVQLEAVKYNIGMLRWIDEPTEKVLEYCRAEENK